MDSEISLDIKRKIAKGGSWALLGKILSAILGFVANIVLARILSPSDFGIFILLQALVTISVTIITLGFDKGAVRFISAEIAKGREYNILFIVKKIFLIILISFTIWSVIFISFFSKFLDSLLNTAVIKGLEWFIIIYVFIAIYQSIVKESFRGMHRIDYVMIYGGSIRGGILYSFIFLILTSIFMLQNRKIGLEILLGIVIISVLISFLSGFFHLIKELKKKISLKSEKFFNVKESFGIVLPMLLSDLIVLLMYRSDVWIIGMFSSKENVALYGAAAKLMILVNSSLIIINAVVPPIISELFTKNKLNSLENVLRKTATIAAIPALLILLIFIIIPGNLLGLVYGSFYSKGGMVLIILSVGQFFNVWAGSCQFTLLMTNNQKYNLIINSISSIIIAILSLTLIQIWGIYGVAMAFSIGLILENILMIYVVKMKLGIWTQVYFNIFQYKNIIKSSIAYLTGM